MELLDELEDSLLSLEEYSALDSELSDELLSLETELLDDSELNDEDDSLLSPDDEEALLSLSALLEEEGLLSLDEDSESELLPALDDDSEHSDKLLGVEELLSLEEDLGEEVADQWRGDAVGELEFFMARKMAGRWICALKLPRQRAGPPPV